MEIEEIEEKHATILTYEFKSIRTIVLSTLAWAICYQIFKYIFPKKSPEFNSRLLTWIHGIIATIIGLNQCLLNENPFEHPDWITTNIQNFLLVFSLGYFIYDLIWCSYYRTETGLMIMHHLYTIYALKAMVWKGYSGAQACCCLGCMEITNPVLQLRWFIRSEGYHKTITFILVELLFFILFFTFRMLIGSYIALKVLFEEKNDTDFKIATMLLHTVSCLFMVQIFKYAILKYGSNGRFWKSQMDLTTEEIT
ncbi:hypothetical protein HHI36_010076 [Cryptolaemus montrouzieri]|uniref:TLC domain-containing protein n=1 Tax=Cryptolaemus montrouzieri TaxID=559131 RepID=A0ABD2MHU7_9CUCU